VTLLRLGFQHPEERRLVLLIEQDDVEKQANGAAVGSPGC
jgi:hypothetical protein